VLAVLLLAPVALFALFGAPQTGNRPRNSEMAGVPPPASAPRRMEAEPRAGGSPPRAPIATAPSAPAPRPAAPAASSAPPPAASAPPPTRGVVSGAKTESPDWDVVPVFYGTDRGRAADTKRLRYNADRAGRLELGRVLVTVPKVHQMPNVERPWAIRVPFFDITIYEQKEDPKLHFTMKEIKSLSRDEFLSEVRARLAASKTFENRAVVFIHGYNTEFDFAAYRTAQMSYDLKFDGAAFMYSWPANGGITSYVYDRDSAEQAEPHLRNFLELVVRESGAKSVSLIAHSMGNLPLLRTLRELGPNLPAGVKLDQIILAAPDVDRTLFQQLARDISRYGNGVTMYAASNDRAMTASRTVASGAVRAGDVPPEGPLVLSGIDTIDVSATANASIATNHSLYAERDALMKDIGILLRDGVRPPDRREPSLLRVPGNGGDFWRFP
jgi:esterase/lipase superfamily enzyme